MNIFGAESKKLVVMMKKRISLIYLILTLIHSSVFSQAPIPQSNYTIQAFSSQTGNAAVRAIDSDTTTFWATGNNPPLPAYLEIDLAQNYDINGFSILPKTISNNNKPLGYELYLSNNGTNWGAPETTGIMSWSGNNDLGKKEFFFGAISARYARIVFLSGTASNNNIQTSEIEIYESSSVPTGQVNQTLTFNNVANKYSTDAPFVVASNSSSGLPITYTVVSGPASVNGNNVTLTGAPGVVTVKAEQLGNATYYPVSKLQTFEVYDLTTYSPTITTRLTSNFPVEMPSLIAYPVYIKSSIAHPDSLAIDSMVFEVGGQSHLAQVHSSGYFYYLWTPSFFGAHTINLKSYSSNGNMTIETKNITVTNTISNQNVTTLNGVNITFGGTNSRWYSGTYSMPQHVGAYDNVTANLTINCPATANACDDWDRYAYIDIKAPDGNWIQIIRYITPYGVACNHSIDLTDYASLLQGEFEFRMFIDTWGTGGWLATLDFDHQAGTPAYAYSMIDEIWDGSYNFGNPANLQPLDTINYSFPINVQDAKLSISNTGHGWGSNNSQNAAEFYNATNFVYLDGVNTFTQNLWNNCNPNPDNCTGQQGTWYHSRAGWCPGAIAPPSIWSLSTYVNSGIELIYEFDPTYTDFCHPNNPNCNSGVTCPDCNDNYSASYRVDAHVISYSNNPLLYDPLFTEVVDNTISYDINIYPNPVNTYFQIDVENIEGELSLTIYTIEGKGVRTYFFKSKEEINAKNFDVSNLPAGNYFVSIENKYGTGTKKLIIK